MSSTRPPIQKFESTTFIGGGNHIQGNHAVVNIHSSSEVDQLLANSATSALYDTAEIEEPARCHPGTREAILRRLRASLDARSAEKPFVWLHGAAGAGKSAIARSLCEDLRADDQPLLSFFFFRASPGRNDPSRFIATLALQFQAIIPQLREHIKDYIHHNPHIFTQSLDTQAQHLFIQPVQRLHTQGALPSSPSPVAIVVDGLDECENAGHRRDVLNVLHKLKSKLPFPITALVASRPNRDIELAFKQPPFEDETAEEALNLEADVDADILKFYTDSFAKIEKFHLRSRYLKRVNGIWPAPEILQLLVEKTSGQFVFATTVIRFVEPDTSDPDERLQILIGALPPLHYRPFQQLDAIYHLILSLIEPDRIQTVLLILGIFLCDYCPTNYVLPTLPKGIFTFGPTYCDAKIVEWILDLKDGQCRQSLVGLEALLALVPPIGTMQIYHKSFTDFLFDSSRSDKFYIPPDFVYEYILRSFIKHHFYHSAFHPRLFMFYNMAFFVGNARITPELLSAFGSIDFVQSDLVVQQLEPAKEDGEDSWLRICDLFVRSLLNSTRFPDQDRLVSPLVASLRAVATKRLSVYIENPTLWPLLYMATRDGSAYPGSEYSVELIPEIPLDLLRLERANGYHISLSGDDPTRISRACYVLHETRGPLFEVASAALPQCGQSLDDNYMVTFLLELLERCVQGAIEPSFLIRRRTHPSAAEFSDGADVAPEFKSLGFLTRVLRVTNPHEALYTKLSVFASAFKEQMDTVTTRAISRYGQRLEVLRADRELWDSNNPNPILHRLTDDWNRLEDVIASEQVSEAPALPLRRPVWLSPLVLYPIPIVLVVGVALYRRGLFSR